jgi:NAD(P)-dependent dehydrogenase (short-subunit alcohol dehydrogenase family)
MISATVERFGRLDILFNNAGIMSPGLLHQVSEAEWDRVISINLTAAFLACKYALPELMKHGGVILVTASVAGLEGRTAHAAYCASKAGVINMIKNVAMDYAKYGIRANCLCPGGVATNISTEALRGLSDAAKERLAKWSGEAVPMARIAQPEELASAALFLCSDDASFVTGSAMVVDGGSIAGHTIPLVE